MSGIGRHCTLHTWLTPLYTDSQDAIYLLQSFSDPGMALLLPSFKGKTVPWCWHFSLVFSVRLQDVCAWDSWQVSLSRLYGTILHIEAITTKTSFVFVNYTSVMNHEKAEWGPFDASFLPQTAGSSLVRFMLSNIVVRSNIISCVGLKFDIWYPKRSPLPFSHVMSHSHTLTLSSPAPK